MPIKVRCAAPDRGGLHRRRLRYATRTPLLQGRLRVPVAAFSADEALRGIGTEAMVEHNLRRGTRGTFQSETIGREVRNITDREPQPPRPPVILPWAQAVERPSRSARGFNRSGDDPEQNLKAPSDTAVVMDCDATLHRPVMAPRSDDGRFEVVWKATTRRNLRPVLGPSGSQNRCAEGG